MKYTLFALALVFALTGNAQEGGAELFADGPVMNLTSDVVDYGKIEQNSDPLRTFEFTNTGTAPLVITAAKGSCGCTVPKYPKEPIMPGATAEIEVRYDTARLGMFTKTVTLTTNAVNSTEGRPAGTFVLTIKGEVKVP